MRIDWTQTLLGADGAHPAEEPPAAGRSVLAALKLGRIAGLIAAAAGLGVALVALALGGIAGGALTCLVFACLIAGHAGGLALLLRFEHAGVAAAGAMSLALPLVGLAGGFGVGAVAALAAIAVLDIAAHRRALRDMAGTAANRRLRLLQAVACLAAASGGVLAGGASALSVAVFAIACLPMLALAALPAPAPPIAAPAPDPRPLAAMLAAALGRLPGRQVLTDITGRIDPLPAASFAIALEAEHGLPENLTDAVLIADRPPLLHALSRAIHGGETGAGLTLRLRIDEPGRAPIAPPLFAERRVTVAPAAGLAGRAIVTIEPTAAQERLPEPGDAAPARRPAEGALLARAFHDCVAPFNAGLGYLEMLSDPLVAPRDIATFRAHAGEAYKAVIEAHRNALLMARWLRLAESAARPAPVLCRPADLLRESLRLAHLDLPVNEGEGAELADLAPEPARFAMLVLLRAAFAEAAAPLSLRLDANGRDLAVTLTWEPAPTGGRVADTLQEALEDAASRHAGAEFRPLGRGGRRLVLAEALQIGRAKPAGGGAPGSVARLAS